VQDTVTGPSPSTQTRRYCLDADSNRVALASDPSITDLGCPPVQHSYDAADRVIDPGYGYDPLGRTLTVPAADVAGGAGEVDLAVGYFDTDLVATQTQGTTVKTFTLDPAGRLGGATDTVNGTTTRSIVNHYADPSDAPAWITTTTGAQSSWTRNVAGLAGDLAATEDNTGTVTLQLANLHGDIVATAADDPAATGTTGYVEATEYGTPRPTTTVTPDRYGWLGAKQRSTDDLAGLVLMGVRLYNPATGRFLQPDPVKDGSASAYTYPVNPLNYVDLDGRCWSGFGWACKAAKAVAHAAATAGRYAWDHRGTIASGAAMAACFGGPLVCGIAQGSAWLIRSQQRGYRHYRANAEDAIWIGATFGLGQAFRVGARGLRGVAKWVVKGAAATPGVVKFGGCHITHNCDF
jgi:RHS repeat-associated protein